VPGAVHDGGAWWRGAVGYQVYLRSFDDASGDGIGDLAGLRRRLPYLADLGVDFLWVTPFYPSPQADHGYDVADYTDVDPTFGSCEELEALLGEAHGLGLRVIVDVVPNHTSDRHPWFADATASRDAARRGYYVWRDPAPGGGPPNNWVSKFGGPAWTWHEPTGQYYMHTFLPEQPDLNWADERVREEFDRILRFWLDRGVDGFRVDTAHLLTEDPEYRDNPQHAAVPADADPTAVYESFEHRHDLDQPDVVDVYRRWHRIVAPRGGMLLGEVYLLSPAALHRYVDDGALDLAFYFPALKTPWDAGRIREALAEAAGSSRGRFAWPLSSHDDPRAADRFGGGPRGAQRALAYLALLSGLPGSTCFLQGDELGLSAGEMAARGLRDPIAIRNAGAVGRDGSRTPMPWGGGPSFGFSAGEPWLPFPAGTHEGDTVEAQQRDPASPLARTRRLLAVRRDLPDLRGDAPLRWLTEAGPVLAYRRGDTVVALNTAPTAHRLPLPGSWSVRYCSAGEVAAEPGGLRLPPESTAVAILPRP
jgi:alpha-glucosidase